ncbi:serine hydrolase [Paenibacillus sp. CF384]|uniref:serine hydrolase domain-containing protein n=1 Tax=Paenibacillus sp. CF384 TaxID=1884382 RepID=UPI000894A96D|nr:serine hydrolase domain-containing protein [Paenibacillus sp. CF384]SDW15042.1 CubicO group peptidase, beta-lactamase class C family [Paenibacillus sp. CF384]
MDAAKTSVFNELNQYVLDIRNQISASATSVVVIQNDQIVNEYYAGYHDKSPNSRMIDERSQFNVASIRKTYLGFAISLALYEGRIKDINDFVSDYLDDVDESIIAQTTIRHLLTHTHGLQGPMKRLFPSGTDWKYNNAGVNLLIRIVQQVFNQTLAEVINERIIEPYGFTETGWRREKNDNLVWLGEEYLSDQGGEANLFVSTRELAYWGQIHLSRGMYMGKQILPAALFDQVVSIATPSRLDESLPRNGFFWWVKDKFRPLSELGNELPNGSYQSLGFYGNAVLVIPAYNAVAVRMLNQLEPNPADYDYLQDIQGFGNLVVKGLSEQ